MATPFSFEDFLLYTKAPNADITLFSAIAPGVISYVESTYGIVLEKETAKAFTYFLRSNTTILDLPIAPINSITSITQDSVDISFKFYGDKVLLDTQLITIDIPLVFTLDAGYTNIPGDLKLAVYQHIESLYFKSKNSTDNISKVVNTSGNTVYFKDSILPEFSKLIYNKYSNRLIAYYE